MNYTSGHGIFFFPPSFLSFFFFLHCDPGTEAVTVAKYSIMQLFLCCLEGLGGTWVDLKGAVPLEKGVGGGGGGGTNHWF